jgi:agmatine deiminase
MQSILSEMEVETMRRVIAEWEKQRAVLMAFPHQRTDWYDVDNPHTLHEALSPFIRIAQAIAYSQPVYILCDTIEETKSLFCSTHNMSFIQLPTNDTWTRDYGYISIKEYGKTKLLDFTFNAWGGKFEASLDNAVNRHLHQKGYLGTTPLESIDFVLEGGSIESDGEETILTTTACLCNPNRNGGLTKNKIEEKLKLYLGATRILWLDHGYLEGDDTDSHIDTLARFVNPKTIMYVQCEDKNDVHYNALKAMEQQLKSFTQSNGKPYTLIPLPMVNAKFDTKGNRLPATYANFLITNHALLYPTYEENQDKIAHEIFSTLFPNKEIIPINALKLIEQGGSLHCSTMQIAT